MRGKDPVVGEIKNSSHFLFQKIMRKSAKKVLKRSFVDLLVSYFGTCRMVAWYKEVIVLEMKIGPRAELRAHLR
jgi:hypothetical protein